MYIRTKSRKLRYIHHNIYLNPLKTISKFIQPVDFFPSLLTFLHLSIQI